MNETLLVGLIGLGGAVLGALITAFVQPLWSNFVSKRSKLLVEIEHSHFYLPLFLDNQIKDYVYNYNLKVRPSDETKGRLLDISSCHGLTKVAIQNRSKRSIEGLVVHLNNNDTLIADLTIDGERKPSLFGKVCSIGTLRAGAKCDVTLWTIIDSTSRWSAFDRLVVSANEYDKISLKFLAPDYISGTKLLISRKIFWRTFWALLILFDLFVFLVPLIKH